MRFKYCIQKLFGIIFNDPIIPINKTVGYSLVRSEKSNYSGGKYSRIIPPFFISEVSLGDYSYIAKNSTIMNTIIGKFCSIGPNFCCGLGRHPTNGISTSPMFYSNKKQNGTSVCEENIFEENLQTRIGNDVFIGANVTILDGVNIGDGAIIGAGAVVTKDIPPYAIAVGIPAKVHKFRFDKETIDRLIEKQWWNTSEEELKNIHNFFYEVNSYLDK